MYSGHVADAVSLLWRYEKVEGLLELGVDCEAERSFLLDQLEECWMWIGEKKKKWVV
jgi:hypothetical protein